MGTSANAERRHVPRRPFRGTVELALSHEPDGYEADAVDLSVGGMALKTAFLPDVGSELECRFALEDGASIAARGEVVWAKDSGAEAGEFGLRFVDLAKLSEDAIRGTFKKRVPLPPPPEVSSASTTTEDVPEKVRLHVPGMGAPLRARVRTRMDDAIVVGSELSFLKLGEPVAIERDGERIDGRFEDVSVEIDPRTRVASLVLTLALATLATRPAAAPRLVREEDEGDDERGREGVHARQDAPAREDLPTRRVVAARASVRAGAQATEFLSSQERDETLASAGVDPAADSAGAHEAVEEGDADAIVGAQDGVRRAPPAWLVTVLQRLRALNARLLPAFARGFGALGARLAPATRALRARLGRPAAAEPIAASRAVAPGLRKQHPAGEPDATPVVPAAAARKRLALYALAGAGVAAIAVALYTGHHDHPPAAPHPQVTVAAATDTAATPADPTNAGAATPEGQGPDGLAGAPSANGAVGAQPEPADLAPSAPSYGAAPRGMPSDLVAAARSRSADVEDAPPPIRNAHPVSRTAPVFTTAHAAAPVAAAPAPAASSGRVLGNPSVRTGTVLRLRMDGPVTALSGGLGAGNTITVHLAGRRSLDLGAPLVRQDTRLVNAGVYNRGGNVELTLRFRDAVPAFSVRGRGDVLEVVLAAPAPAVPVGRRASAAAHAPAARPAASDSVITVGRQRRAR